MFKTRLQSPHLLSLETKYCYVCHTEKPLSDFSYRKDRHVYRAVCKECCNDKHRLRRTGWSKQDVIKVLKEQDGKCAICGCTLDTEPKTALACDHDHGNGHKRGLLCMRCNTALGLFDDNPNVLHNAVTYLNKFSD